MKKGLLIILAVIALTFGILLCACSDANQTQELTLNTNTGIVLEGADISSNTNVSLVRVTSEEESSIEKIVNSQLLTDGFTRIYIHKLINSSNELDFELNNDITATIDSSRIQFIIDESCSSRLYVLDNYYQLEFLTYELSEDTVKFTSKPFKYIITIRGEASYSQSYNDPHDCAAGEHNLQLYNAVEPTFGTNGYKAYYVCLNCGKHYDINHNEISSIKELREPKLSQHILLYVNGEKKGEFSQAGYSTIEWTISGINLKKNDVITLVDAEDNSRTIPQYAVVDANISIVGKVINDVENATITLKAYSTSSGVNISIPGRIFDIYCCDYYLKSYLVEPDKDGNCVLSNMRFRKNAPFYFYEQKTKEINALEFTLGSESDESQVTINSNNFSFKEAGIYNLSLNVNTRVLNFELVSIAPTAISSISFADISGNGSHTEFIQSDRNNPYFSVRKNFLAVDGRNSFNVSGSKGEINDLTVASGSEKYITIDTNGRTITFVENGSFDVKIDDFTHKVYITKVGDATPDYRILIGALGRKNAYYEMEKGDADNIFVKKNIIIRSGEYIWATNLKDGNSRFHTLKESSDLDYASNSDRLSFKKSGVYNINFDANNYKVDIEFVRDLNRDEIEIPTKIFNSSLNGEFDKEYKLYENPNNSDELMLQRVYITTTDKNYYVEFYKDNYRMSDVSMEGESDYFEIETGPYHPGKVHFKTTGVFNIYINKYTHIMRVEKV